MQDDGLNAAAWATEWAYLSAGMGVRSFIAGERTLACAWRDQFITHAAWLRKPFTSWRTDRPPCEHPYSYYVPAEAERATWFPRATALEVGDHREWALWLPADAVPAEPPARLSLIPIRTEDQWQAAVTMRDEAERAFPRTYTPAIAARMVALTRLRLATIQGGFYLAVSDDEIVGGIGLTLHETAAGRLGRLRDIEILPAHQGRGLGGELLLAAFQEGRRLRLDGLCMRAFEHDWPKDWYLRRGFRQVGTWTRFFRW